jgi:branched-chain amino acid transport system substrate-binding protein
MTIHQQEGKDMHPISARKLLRLAAPAALVLVLALWGWRPAMAKEFVIGAQIDRSGPTNTVGPYVGDGCQDYLHLFNMKHMMGKDTIRAFEIDHGYQVPRSIEAYERMKEAHALTISIYGTPQTKAITPKLEEDHILGTSPGFGSADGANGEKFPYLFPVAATYWSQAGAAVKFVEEQWKGSGQPKIAYIFYDNPAGREPLPVLEALQKQLGFQLRTFAVPPPGVDMRPQVLDIARNYKADWVIAHLFGKGPSVSIKEFDRVRFPLNRVISFVWGTGVSDMIAVGWKNAEGYYGMQFTGIGEDHPVLQQIRDMYKAEGKPEPESMKHYVYYERGVFICALHAEAIREAVKKHGEKVTPKEVKEALEHMSNFTLAGITPPLKLSAKDHEGGGWVKIYQVHDGKFVPVTDWMHGYRDVIEKMVYGG